MRKRKQERGLLASDSGMALPIVLAVSLVLFLLVTMVLSLVAYQCTQSVKQTARTKAMHIADAGINAYLYEVRRNQTYYATNPSLGGIMVTGRWTVSATAPTVSSPLTLRSVGSLKDNSATRTVVAQVGFPTFADYMFLTNADIAIGTNAYIDGKVRSNGNIDNAGHVTRRCYASGTAGGSGLYDAGKESGVAKINFASVTTDMNVIKTAAQGASTYFASLGSSAYGYELKFSGASASLSKVTATTNNGPKTTTFIKTVSVPACGVFYFDDEVWVSGTYSAAVTIASSSDIWIPTSLKPSTMTSSFTMGLVAQNNVRVPSAFSGMDTNMVITAAMLAQSGYVGAEFVQGSFKDSLTITGSIAKWAESGFVQIDSHNNQIAGFQTRSYTYDTRLDVDPPPLYPQIRDGSLKVKTWVEN